MSFSAAQIYAPMERGAPSNMRSGEAGNLAIYLPVGISGRDGISPPRPNRGKEKKPKNVDPKPKSLNK